MRHLTLALLGAGLLYLSISGPPPASGAGWPAASTDHGPPARGARTAAELCPAKVNQPAATARKPETVPIEFDVHESDPVLNFGTGRKPKRDFIVFTASRRIPPTVRAADFEIDNLEPLRRIGSSELESERLPSPTYTRPHFFDHRKKMAVNLCVRPQNGDPGTYTGQFLLVGPGAIASIALAQTAQLKAEEGDFWLPFTVILLVTLVVLAFRAFTELDRKSTKKDVAARVLVALGSLAAAAAAMYIPYSHNPTWGENGGLLASGALFAAAFTAAGLGTLLAGGPEKIASALGHFGSTRDELKQRPSGAHEKHTGRGDNKPG
ncbi:MAG TPA: hypothetical protein VF731_02570 [Solirubrobacterales bacterium]